MTYAPFTATAPAMRLRGLQVLRSHEHLVQAPPRLSPSCVARWSHTMSGRPKKAADHLGLLLGRDSREDV